MRSSYEAYISRLRAELTGRDGDAKTAILRRYIDDLHVAVLVADDDGRYVAANQMALDLTGYGADDILQRHVNDLTPVSDVVAATAIWRRFIREGTQRGAYVLYRRDGSKVAVRYEAFASVAPGLHVSLLTPAP